MLCAEATADEAQEVSLGAAEVAPGTGAVWVRADSKPCLQPLEVDDAVACNRNRVEMFGSDISLKCQRCSIDRCRQSGRGGAGWSGGDRYVGGATGL